MSAELGLVPTCSLKILWPHVAAFVDQALERTQGEYSPDSIIDGLVNEDYQLWILAEDGEVQGIYVTTLVSYPHTLTAFIIIAAADDMQKLLDNVESIEHWARLQGASYLEFFGPRAWSRVLKPQGYFEAYSITRKLLESTH